MPLQDYVQKYNPIEQTPFRQKEWLDTVGATGPDADGKCYAFSLAYLLALRMGGSGKDLIDTLNKAAEKNDEKNDAAVIAEIMGSGFLAGDDNWVGTDLFHLQHSPALRDKAFHAFKLKPTAPLRFKHKNKKFDDLAAYIATDTSTYSLLAVPNHALAAASRPFGEAKWCFFDPNLGEAVFGAKVDLQLCIANFFANKTIKKHYKRQQIGAKSGPAYDRQKEEMEKMTVDVVRCTEL